MGIKNWFKRKNQQMKKDDSRSYSWHNDKSWINPHTKNPWETNEDLDKITDAQRRGWTENEKELVRIRQNGLCMMCNKPPPRWEYHHKDGNRSNNVLSNCEGLCPNCHSVKTHDA